MPLEVDNYGGDRWQLLLTDPGSTLAAGLFFRAFLRSCEPHCDTRFVAAVGSVDFVPGDKVSEGDGEAFRLSGQTLDGLKRRRMAFAAVDPALAARWDLDFELIDALAFQWSAKQALAVRAAIQGWTQGEIGTLWDPPIEQATVNRHLQTAAWPAIERAIGESRAFLQPKK